MLCYLIDWSYFILFLQFVQVKSTLFNSLLKSDSDPIHSVRRIRLIAFSAFTLGIINSWPQP